MRSEIIKTRNVSDPNSRLKALRNNPRFHGVGPASVPPTRLNNIASPDKSITAIRHAKSPALAENLLAERQKPQWSQTRKINGMEAAHTELVNSTRLLSSIFDMRSTMPKPELQLVLGHHNRTLSGLPVHGVGRDIGCVGRDFVVGHQIATGLQEEPHRIVVGAPAFEL